MTDYFDGKIAIVTGAASGIGLGISKGISAHREIRNGRLDVVPDDWIGMGRNMGRVDIVSRPADSNRSGRSW